MKRLEGRPYDICAGRTELCAHKVHWYRRAFAARGYAVPPLHRRPREQHWDGLGDALAWLTRKLRIGKRGCGRCYQRQVWLNAIVPFPIRWPAMTTMP